jgi:hypothetical protein
LGGVVVIGVVLGRKQSQHEKEKAGFSPKLQLY